MKLHEALECLEIPFLGYGDDFIIIGDDFEPLREVLAGSVELKIIHGMYFIKELYLIKYDIQNETSIVGKLIDMKSIFSKINRDIDSHVKYDEEKNIINILSYETKDLLEKKLGNLINIKYESEKLLWVLDIDYDNIPIVFKTLVDCHRDEIEEHDRDTAKLFKKFIRIICLVVGLLGIINCHDYLLGLISVIFLIVGLTIITGD